MRDETAVRQLFVDVAEQPLVSRDHDLGGPPSGGDAEHPELGGYERGIALGILDERVHPFDERADDRCAARVVVRKLGAHAAAKGEQSRPLVSE